MLQPHTLGSFMAVCQSLVQNPNTLQPSKELPYDASDIEARSLFMLHWLADVWLHYNAHISHHPAQAVACVWQYLACELTPHANLQMPHCCLCYHE